MHRTTIIPVVNLDCGFPLVSLSSLWKVSIRGRTGAKLRFSLVVVQFALNAILGTLMATTYLQNRHLLSADPGFNSDNVVIVSGVANPVVKSRLETLIDRIENVPSVLSVTGSSQHPFQEIHNQGRFTTDSEENTDNLNLYRFSIGEGFFDLYDISSINGRTLNQFPNDDTVSPIIATPVINVVVNLQALEILGIANSGLAIDRVFFSNYQDRTRQTFRIVGVVQNANLLGLANDIKPSIFRMEPDSFTSLSIRIAPDTDAAALTQINAAWSELFPEIPVESTFLVETFRSRFAVLAGINRVLIALSVVALLLATFGLYGLISVLAHQRKHEIAIRKVLGATVVNILRPLSWQFTKPVTLALCLGAPIEKS